MTRLYAPLAALVLFAGCGREEARPTSAARAPTDRAGPGGEPAPPTSLAEARRGFQTKLTRRVASNEPVPEPPPALFRTVRYESPAGRLAAYLSTPPKGGGKHPAMLWIFGGFDNGIGETAWAKAPPTNDQSAGAFRKAGLVLMFPSLRGGNDNPGSHEAFYGEVDDVLAAADYLAAQPFVDPKRIYLGGHSTGGTLALLVAASGDRFRAVFSFGPVHEVAGYGPDNLPFDLSDRRERELRSPLRWQNAIKTPTYVFEGTEGGNLAALQALRAYNKNPKVQYYAVEGADHFSILAPVTRLIAAKLVVDSGETADLPFTEAELSASIGR